MKRQASPDEAAAAEAARKKLHRRMASTGEGTRGETGFGGEASAAGVSAAGLSQNASSTQAAGGGHHHHSQDNLEELYLLRRAQQQRAALASAGLGGLGSAASAGAAGADSNLEELLRLRQMQKQQQLQRQSLLGLGNLPIGGDLANMEELLRLRQVQAALSSADLGGSQLERLRLAQQQEALASGHLGGDRLEELIMLRRARQQASLGNIDLALGGANASARSRLEEENLQEILGLRKAQQQKKLRNSELGMDAAGNAPAPAPSNSSAAASTSSGDNLEELLRLRRVEQQQQAALAAADLGGDNLGELLRLRKAQQQALFGNTDLLLSQLDPTATTTTADLLENMSKAGIGPLRAPPKLKTVPEQSTKPAAKPAGSPSLKRTKVVAVLPPGITAADLQKAVPGIKILQVSDSQAANVASSPRATPADSAINSRSKSLSSLVPNFISVPAEDGRNLLKDTQASGILRGTGDNSTVASLATNDDPIYEQPEASKSKRPRAQRRSSEATSVADSQALKSVGSHKPRRRRRRRRRQSGVSMDDTSSQGMNSMQSSGLGPNSVATLETEDFVTDSDCSSEASFYSAVLREQNLEEGTTAPEVKTDQPKDPPGPQPNVSQNAPVPAAATNQKRDVDDGEGSDVVIDSQRHRYEQFDPDRTIDQNEWGEWDIPLGRRQEVRTHIGNFRFREIIDKYRPQYQSFVKKGDKSRIAKKIYYMVKSKGGRFLDQRKKKNLPAPEPAKKNAPKIPWDQLASDYEWVEIPPHKAQSKISQALRQGARHIRGRDAKKYEKEHSPGDEAKSNPDGAGSARGLDAKNSEKDPTINGEGKSNPEVAGTIRGREAKMYEKELSPGQSDAATLNPEVVSEEGSARMEKKVESMMKPQAKNQNGPTTASGGPNSNVGSDERKIAAKQQKGAMPENDALGALLLLNPPTQKESSASVARDYYSSSVEKTTHPLDEDKEQPGTPQNRNGKPILSTSNETRASLAQEYGASIKQSSQPVDKAESGTFFSRDRELDPPTSKETRASLARDYGALMKNPTQPIDRGESATLFKRNQEIKQPTSKETRASLARDYSSYMNNPTQSIGKGGPGE